VHVLHETSKPDFRRRRCINGRLGLRVPTPVRYAKRTRYMRRGRPLLTSQFVAQLAPGAKVVKAINHMLVANFEAGGDVNGAKRVAFVSADDADAKTTVGALLRTFGFAVIDLGNLRDDGLIQQAGGPLAGLDILQRL
jgi:predicted dinucleotide-binding enzyme